MTQRIRTLVESWSSAGQRCDRCGASAKLRVVLHHGELTFCGHHARQHTVELTKVAVAAYRDPEFSWP